MLASYVIGIAAVVGILASRGSMRLALIYIPVAFIGALLGALVALGDAPLLLRYPVFNPYTLALLGSGVFVYGAWRWRRSRTTND